MKVRREETFCSFIKIIFGLQRFLISLRRKEKFYPSILDGIRCIHFNYRF